MSSGQATASVAGRGKRLRPLAGVLATVALLVPASVKAQPFDPFAGPVTQPDLSFPDQPRPLTSGRESMMFKPEGPGPFPALVLMPSCDGHSKSTHIFDLAQRAVAKGYVALVIDPLTPRNVGLNCTPPPAVPSARLLKDAFDAANHLRKQAFVDKASIGLMGTSQGAMVGLGVASAKYAGYNGNASFRAVVSLYPVCIYKQLRVPGSSTLADLRFLPEGKIVVPLLVEMGDEDTEGSSAGTAADCKALLDPLKTQGDPVSYIIYHATHEWDDRQLANSSQVFSKRGLNGQVVIYQYNAAVTEQSANDAFAFFDHTLKR